MEAFGIFRVPRALCVAIKLIVFSSRDSGGKQTLLIKFLTRILRKPGPTNLPYFMNRDL